MPKFSTILIANRGEIACRILRSAQALGYGTVALYTPADAEAPHVRLADSAVLLPRSEVAASYLNIPAVLDAARRAGADAVHPGYGFLSENTEFARACREAGLVFIGPAPEAIEAMGNKAEAKRRMRVAGVPCIPGYDGAEQSLAALRLEALHLGLPVMVKAAAGGGGRGMRLVSVEQELDAALAGARSEAEHAFGSGELLLEQAITGGRHVEIQILADGHGHTLHLGERDCSLQRRHQKVIEEAPSPAVAAGLRARMGAAAVAAARAVDYVGAGTVEFMLTPSGEFFFLEMNTRLQVEHPVTELVTGLDLVEWQLRIAAGEALPWAQDEIRFEGHAIEARLYAEDPARDFLPQTGTVLVFEPAPGVRVDAGIAPGQHIGPYYDPMLAKIIAHGRNREEARRVLARALTETNLLGLRHNGTFLSALLAGPDFVAGRADTGLIERDYPPERRARPEATALQLSLAAALFVAREHPARFTAWHSAGPCELDLALADEADAVRVLRVHLLGDQRYRLDGEADSLSLLERDETRVRLLWQGIQHHASYAYDGDTLWLGLAGEVFRFQDRRHSPPRRAESAGLGLVRAPMAGCVQKLCIQAGEAVRKGQVLLILEAMKMEHALKADRDGLLAEILVGPGEQVAAHTLLIRIHDGAAS